MSPMLYRLSYGVVTLAAAICSMMKNDGRGERT